MQLSALNMLVPAVASLPASAPRKANKAQQDPGKVRRTVFISNLPQDAPEQVCTHSESIALHCAMRLVLGQECCSAAVRQAWDAPSLQTLTWTCHRTWPRPLPTSAP